MIGATRALKRALVLRRVPTDRRSQIHFVPADPKEADLTASLRQAGRKSERAVAIWEGVRNYLDALSVQATFTALASSTVPGSRIIFT